MFFVRAYHTATKSLDFFNYIMPCRRQFDWYFEYGLAKRNACLVPRSTVNNEFHIHP